MLEGVKISLPFAVYVARGIEPAYQTLPWQEDTKETPASTVEGPKTIQ